MSWVVGHVPVAIILLAGGLVACFLGYRLLKILLGSFGFLGGAAAALWFLEDVGAWAVAVGTIAAGIGGAVLAVVTYLAGVAIAGAALGAGILNAARGGEDSSLWLVLVVCFAGAMLALVLRRYVLILATAAGGSWTAIVGGLALAGHGAGIATVNGDLLRLPPAADPGVHLYFVLGWSLLGALAVLVQLRDLWRRRLLW